KKDLYSCLQVNSCWCKISLSILWKNPFKDFLYVKYKRDIKLEALFIRTCILCLREEAKSNSPAKNKRITSKDGRKEDSDENLSLSIFKKPLFNYIEFIKVLDYVRLYECVDSWVKQYGDYGHNYEDNNVNKYEIGLKNSILYRELCNLILSSTTTKTRDSTSQVSASSLKHSFRNYYGKFSKRIYYNAINGNDYRYDKQFKYPKHLLEGFCEKIDELECLTLTDFKYPKFWKRFQQKFKRIKNLVILFGKFAISENEEGSLEIANLIRNIEGLESLSIIGVVNKDILIYDNEPRIDGILRAIEYKAQFVKELTIEFVPIKIFRNLEDQASIYWNINDDDIRNFENLKALNFKQSTIDFESVAKLIKKTGRNLLKIKLAWGNVDLNSEGYFEMKKLDISKDMKEFGQIINVKSLIEVKFYSRIYISSDGIKDFLQSVEENFNLNNNIGVQKFIVEKSLAYNENLAFKKQFIRK
ncbi:4812_t:CDS:2, partial [Entrophospora sp. SA101]